jgi:tetratricopeptide (TPR) repeat protein
MKVYRLGILVAIIAGVVLAIIALPSLAGAWYLNLANAQIARALALPSDSPNRFDALAQAQVHLNQARAWSVQPRLAIAQVRVWLTRGEPQRAVDVLGQLDSSLHNDAIAQLLFGTAEMHAGKPDAAYARWRAGGVDNFFINAAYRAQVAHRWDEAEQMAKSAVGSDPQNANAHYVLGDALSRKPGLIHVALEELELATTLTQDSELRATILSRQGEILAAHDEFTAAFALFDEAMAVAPRDARPRTNYARLLLQTQPAERDRAEQMLEHAIAIAPWDTLAFATLAEIAEARGDLERADAWYVQGLARNPHHPALLFHRAQFFARQNRVNDARQAMILALRYETRGDELQKIARALESLK